MQEHSVVGNEVACILAQRGDFLGSTLWWAFHLDLPSRKCTTECTKNTNKAGVQTGGLFYDQTWWRVMWRAAREMSMMRAVMVGGGLLRRHNTLHRCMHLMDIVEGPTCRFCGREEETSIMYLLRAWVRQIFKILKSNG